MKNQITLSLAVVISLIATAPALAVSVTDSDLFTPAQTVTVSDNFPAFGFAGGLVVDGTTDGHVFADIGGRSAGTPGPGTPPQLMSISSFNSDIDTLRFFDHPQFSERTSQTVGIYYSAVNQTSLLPASYTFLGSFVLPTINVSGTGGIFNDDQFATPTFGPTDIASASQGGGGQVVNYTELTGLGIPAGTQSILLDMGANLFGTGLSEVQAYAVPEPSTVVLSSLALVALGFRRR